MMKEHFKNENGPEKHCIILIAENEEERERALYKNVLCNWLCLS
jgi:hypothetical protein